MNHLLQMPQMIQRKLLGDRWLCFTVWQNKSPTRMRSRHKTQNIDMKAAIVAR